MAYEGEWVMRANANQYPFANEDVGIALPLKRVRQTTSIHVNKRLTLTSSAVPDLAWKWIAYVSQPKVLAGISRANSHLPPRFSLSQMEPWSKDRRWQTFFQAASLSTPFQAQEPQYSHIAYTILVDAMGKALRQEMPVRQALDQAARAADAVLAEQRARQGR